MVCHQVIEQKTLTNSLKNMSLFYVILITKLYTGIRIGIHLCLNLKCTLILSSQYVRLWPSQLEVPCSNLIWNKYWLSRGLRLSRTAVSRLSRYCHDFPPHYFRFIMLTKTLSDENYRHQYDRPIPYSSHKKVENETQRSCRCIVVAIMVV